MSTCVENTIESNIVGLRVALEECLGELTQFTPAVAATGTVTVTLVPQELDTVTIGSVTYMFTDLSDPTSANEVLIGATQTETAANLSAAITAGVGAGSTYSVGTVANPDVTSSPSGTSVTITARVAGVAGNAIALSATGGGDVTVPATLTGGVDQIGVGPVWVPLEPNSFSDFGAEVSTTARNPINPSRQRKKGVVTDLNASGGYNTDVTQTNLQDLLQGFLFAAVRSKGDTHWDGTSVSAATATGYTISGFTASVGDLVFSSGWDNESNNGVKRVTAISTGQIDVNGGLTIETAPATVRLSRVGKRLPVGDIAVSVSVGEFPRLTATATDFTTLGLIPGEWIYIGGDEASDQFAEIENNGFKRIRSIAAKTIVLDKSENDMVSDAGTGKTLCVYFGNVLKNEAKRADQKKYSYQFERTLGSIDGMEPDQSEYLVGARCSELSLNHGLSDKMTADLSFMGTDVETRTQAEGLKGGTRPDLQEADAFNTVDHMRRIRLSAVVPGVANPTPLFTDLTDCTITINNTLSANKALGKLGAVGISAGTFMVSGSMTAYFNDIRAVRAVRTNADISLDMMYATNNSGIAVDLPLVTLGNGRVTVEQDQPIMLPLSSDAATGATIHKDLDHTLLFVFFNYLPDLAFTTI